MLLVNASKSIVQHFFLISSYIVFLLINCPLLLPSLFLSHPLFFAGKPVMVVNGAYRGVRAVLETMDTSNFCVSVRIDQVHVIFEP